MDLKGIIDLGSIFVSVKIVDISFRVKFYKRKETKLRKQNFNSSIYIILIHNINRFKFLYALFEFSSLLISVYQNEVHFIINCLSI